MQLLPKDFHNHRGIYATATFLIIIGAVFTFSYMPKLLSEQKESPMVQTFEECQELPDSIIQEKYPAVCVTSTGQQFTQPTPAPSLNPTPEHQHQDSEIN